MISKSVPYFFVAAFLLGTAQAANIRISRVRNLAFPNAAPGDPSQVVTAGDAASAMFTVRGNAGAAYKVTLPASLTMNNGGSSVTASNFTSASQNGYVLSAAGTDTLYVGATRNAVPPGSALGAYSRSFNTTVQYNSGGKSATASAAGSVTLISSLTLTKLTDLSFGTATQGDGSLTINPASGGGRATFTVTGQPNTSYLVTLPSNGTVTMTTGGGGTANHRIALSDFTSSPASPATLPASGSQTLGVGATRAPILATQVTGNYTGTFQITVTYQ